MMRRILRQVFGCLAWLILLPVYLFLILDDSISEEVRRKTIFDKDYE